MNMRCTKQARTRCSKVPHPHVYRSFWCQTASGSGPAACPDAGGSLQGHTSHAHVTADQSLQPGSIGPVWSSIPSPGCTCERSLSMMQKKEGRRKGAKKCAPASSWLMSRWVRAPALWDWKEQDSRLPDTNSPVAVCKRCLPVQPVCPWSATSAGPLIPERGAADVWNSTVYRCAGSGHCDACHQDP